MFGRSFVGVVALFLGSKSGRIELRTGLGHATAMPLATVYTSVQAPADKSAALLGKLSSALATALSKPEAYVMTRLAPDAPMTFGGSAAPSCAVEIKSIGGLTTRTTKTLSEVVCTLVHEALGVPKDRIYVVCTDVPAHMWGFNGSTFG